MQHKLDFHRKSEDENIKDAGLTLDLDEIAKKGITSKEEKSILKWYGIYSSRQPGNHMARVVIPGGVLSSVQVRKLCDISEKHAQGILNLTTRQAIQFHWLKIPAFPDLMRELLEENMSAFHGCGDVTRNVTACSLAETCQFRRLNVRPDAIKTAKYLTSARDLDNLPRKFKINFSGCPAGCAQPYMNCLGAIGVERETSSQKEIGYKVVIGGGMGWKAFVAKELFSFVPADQIQYVSRAIALLFRDHGDRFNRAKSRLKWVVENYGIDKCREIVLENLRKEEQKTEGICWEHFQEAGVMVPERPLVEQNPKGTDEKYSIRILIPKGELNFKQLKEIAFLSEKYADQNIYTTNRQNIELHGVEEKNLVNLKKEIEKAGFKTIGANGLRDIVSCVGTTYCPKAVAKTRDLFDKLHELVHRNEYEDIQYNVIINITGCPNSCSPYRITDIGFRGMRIRQDEGSVEGYEMLLAGSEIRHGLLLGEFKAEDCITVTKTVLDFYTTVRLKDETLTNCINRLGLDAFKKEVFHEVSI